MIRHFVAVRFKDSVDQETRAAIFHELEALRTLISGVQGFHAGPNVSPETPVVHGFLDAFWFDFADEATRDAYLVHPAHQAVGAKLVANAEGGIDGILVVDLKV
jgi:hypothetical protein